MRYGGQGKGWEKEDGKWKDVWWMASLQYLALQEGTVGGGDKWPEFLLPISIITVGCSVQPSMQ